LKAVEAFDLVKTFSGGVRALDGVSFSMGDGEIFGLLGPNGAGKSTAVRILSTLTLPTSGEARVGGVDVVAEPATARRVFGLVAQASGVDRDLTGRENLMLQAQLHGLTGARARSRTDELLKLIGLTDAADRLAGKYSGGMRRRLDVVTGLVHEPRIIFLDEPTTGLDPESRSELWDDLEALRRESGVAMLLTTHYLEEADRLADRVAIVDHGRIVAEGTPDELKSEIQGDTVAIELFESERTEILIDHPGVTSVRRDGLHVYAQVRSGAEALPRILSQLEADGVPVKAATVSRPTLDDVYLFHTGHTIHAVEEDSA